MSRSKSQTTKHKGQQVFNSARAVANTDLSLKLAKARLFKSKYSNFEVRRESNKTVLVATRNNVYRRSNASLAFTDEELKKVLTMFEVVLTGHSSTERELHFEQGYINAVKYGRELGQENDSGWIWICISHPNVGIEASYRFTKGEYLELRKMLS
jgi:hypothetical protein